MKQILLPLIMLILLANTTNAQCNARFYTTLDIKTAKFLTTDSNYQQAELWFFGDGKFSNDGYFTEMASPVEHIYTNLGTYTVIHYVYNASQNCFDSSIQDIVIVDSIPTNDSTSEPLIHFDTLPIIDTIHSSHASFEYFRDGAYDNKRFTFYSTSNALDGISSYLWKIDGNTVSTNPYFTIDIFPDSSHTICLYINTYKGGSAFTCQNIFLADTLKCNKELSFTTIVSSADKKKITFISNQPPANGLTYRWDFGDRTENSNEQQPTHLYTSAGNYSIKLTVYDSLNNCYDTIRQTLDVFDTCSTFTASFKYSSTPGGTVSFTAESNTSILNANWNIYSSRYNDSSMNYTMVYDTGFYNTTNPVYTFRDSGYKHVYLSIQTPLGCWKYYDKTIYISKTYARPSALITAYPNPTKGNIVTIKIQLEKSESIQYLVSNLNGNIVYQGQQKGTEGENAIKIPLQNLDKGQYFVKILLNNYIKISTFQKL